MRRVIQVEQLLVAGATVGVSGLLFAQELVNDGATPSLGLQGILLGSGVALFLFFDRRERKAQDVRNAERRSADEAKDKQIEQLRTEVTRLNERIFKLLGGGE